MRPALISLVPMLAAAVLVMVGGERMARREVESRTPADRNRVLDFDSALREELRRLESVYDGHLDELAHQAADRKAADLESRAEALCGIELIRVFRKIGNDLTIQPGPKSAKLPEIELNPGKRPFDVENAVLIDAAILKWERTQVSVWRAAANPAFRVRYSKPDPVTLVAFLINWDQVKNRTYQHLAAWLESPITPLREAGERLSIQSPDGGTLLGIGPAQHGPAASILPIRTRFGDWQIRSWDGLEISREYDASTLALASTLAVMLVVSGVILMIQQKRALKLAAERVSFVNRVSHEFGAPLTNLSLNLDLATDFLAHRPAEARRRLSLVGEEIERLSRLVANVLTFSRRERDCLEIKPESCIPGDRLRKLLEGFRPSLERRGISIHADICAETPVILDPDALSQIVGNLLSNVEKYAAAGAWLGISCHHREQEILVEVRDRGEGIPAADRERIFLPFERVRDHVSEGASGTGLGLAIGRDLARRMGGDLELIDERPGAKFRLRIPVSPVLQLLPEPHVA